jgi:two-component system, cell cycle response regulator DivK
MPYKVLVADDDADNRIIMSDILTAQGHSVIIAVNGLEAVDLSAKDRPDIIFLDLSMPLMDGWQAAAKLRATPGTANIPIIAFTAHAMAWDEKKAIEAGCNDYLTKPCTPDKILEIIKKWGNKKCNFENN